MEKYDVETAVATAMQRMGGGFVKSLGLTLLKADRTNRERIRQAFPEYFEQYRKIAEQRNWYLDE